MVDLLSISEHEIEKTKTYYTAHMLKKYTPSLFLGCGSGNGVVGCGWGGGMGS